MGLSHLAEHARNTQCNISDKEWSSLLPGWGRGWGKRRRRWGRGWGKRRRRGNWALLAQLAQNFFQCPRPSLTSWCRFCICHQPRCASSRHFATVICWGPIVWLRGSRFKAIPALAEQVPQTSCQATSRAAVGVPHAEDLCFAAPPAASTGWPPGLAALELKRLAVSVLDKGQVTMNKAAT